MAEKFAVTRLPGFTTIAVVAFVALYAPILTLVAYSFNASESAAAWTGFSLDWYRLAFQNDEVKNAALNSLIVAASTSVLATTFGVFAARASTRYAFPGKGPVMGLIMLPMVLPEMILAMALLVVLLSLHLMGGVRLLLIEFGQASGLRKNWIAGGIGFAAATGMAFLLALLNGFQTGTGCLVDPVTGVRGDWMSEHRGVHCTTTPGALGIICSFGAGYSVGSVILRKC